MSKQKQCINCKFAEKPNQNSACNHKVKYPLIDVVEMKYSGSGLPYCDGFKQKYQGGKR